MNGQNAAMNAENNPAEYLPDRKQYHDAYIRLGMLGIQNVADLGCGDGPFVDIMREKNQRKEVYWGVDRDMGKIEAARRKHPDWRFAYGDIMSDQIRMEFVKHGGFLILNVLEFLEGDQDEQLLRSIPPESPVVISVPAFEAPGAVRYFENQREIYDRYSPLVSIKYISKYKNPFGRQWFMATAIRW